jgi:hypothetical protein
VGKNSGNGIFPESFQIIFLFPTCWKEVRKYLCFLSMGLKSGNIYFPICGKEFRKYSCFLPVGKSRELFLFPICGAEDRKYLCFLPVGKKSGNISVSYLWGRI